MSGRKKTITATEARRNLLALDVMSGRDSESGNRVNTGRRIQHEAQIQVQLFEWANLSTGKYPELKLMYHIPNGGKRNAVIGYHLRQQGVKAGLPDICLPVPRGKYHALFIELKAANGRLQDNQRIWLAELNKQGYKAVVCYGFDEAKAAIEAYLALPVSV